MSSLLSSLMILVVLTESAGFASGHSDSANLDTSKLTVAQLEKLWDTPLILHYVRSMETGGDPTAGEIQKLEAAIDRRLDVLASEPENEVPAFRAWWQKRKQAGKDPVTVAEIKHARNVTVMGFIQRLFNIWALEVADQEIAAARRKGDLKQEEKAKQTAIGRLVQPIVSNSWVHSMGNYLGYALTAMAGGAIGQAVINSLRFNVVNQFISSATNPLTSPINGIIYSVFTKILSPFNTVINLVVQGNFVKRLLVKRMQKRGIKPTGSLAFYDFPGVPAEYMGRYLLQTTNKINPEKNVLATYIPADQKAALEHLANVILISPVTLGQFYDQYETKEMLAANGVLQRMPLMPEFVKRADMLEYRKLSEVISQRRFIQAPEEEIVAFEKRRDEIAKRWREAAGEDYDQKELIHDFCWQVEARTSVRNAQVLANVLRANWEVVTVADNRGPKTPILRDATNQGRECSQFYRSLERFPEETQDLCNRLGIPFNVKAFLAIRRYGVEHWHDAPQKVTEKLDALTGEYVRCIKEKLEAGTKENVENFAH